MNTLTAGSAADIDLATGEHWIEHVPAARTRPHQLSFPALIEPRRHHGLWVRPRLRREVAQALCEWLNLVYPTDPDWYPLARFENDLLVVFTGDAAHQGHEIPPDEGGRYPLADIGRWFLSTPTRTAARIEHDLAVLGDPTRHAPRPGEILVTCNPANAPASAFPARIDTRPRQPLIPVFRPEIAEAVAAFCTTHHDLAPDDYPQVYLDGHTLVHVHQHLRVLDNYLPWRIDPDHDGNYSIDGDEWTFHRVQKAPRTS